jgi:hypothetical protein
MTFNCIEMSLWTASFPLFDALIFLAHVVLGRVLIRIVCLIDCPYVSKLKVTIISVKH